MTGESVKAAASRWWLAMLFAAVAAQPSLSYVLMGAVNGTWYPAGYWLASGLVLVSLAMWIAAPWDIRWGAWPTVFLAALLAAWAILMVSSVVKGNVFLGVVAWLPLAVAMIWSKRPTMPSAILATDTFAWTLVVGMMGILVLELAGVLGHRTPVVSAAYELRTYWLPISDALGLPGRWSGPFAHPNLASPVAVFLVVYGLWRQGLTRIVLMAVGVLVLLLTGTRSALGAVVVGVVVLLAAQRGWMDSRRKLLAWGAGAAVLVVLVSVWVGVTGQTFEGRVPMWSRWLALATRSPVLGIGDPGVTLAIQAEELPWWAVHGHNLVLEPLVRYGVVAAAAVVVGLVSALVVTTMGVLRSRTVGLAVLVATLVCGMFESIIDWRYLNAQAVLVLVSVLLVSSREAPSEPEATHTPPGA